MSQMPDADYRQIRAVNCSGLKLFADSPLHYWHRYLNPDRAPETPSKALRLGTLIHCRALEGLEEFNSRYVRKGEYKRNTKEGKAAHEAFLASMPEGAEIIEQDEWDQALDVAHALLKSTAASNLLEGAHGYSEEVIQWVDEESGLLCKAKMDRIQTINGKTYIVDLKTCSQFYGGAGPKGFSKSAANFKYHWQAAFYLDGLRASGDFGEVEDFVFVVVEKEPPYGVGIYRASDQFVQIGRDQYREAMENFAVCQRDDHWPGYDTKIVDLELPRWAA